MANEAKVEELVEMFNELSEALYSDDLNPDPQRRDWAEHRELVDDVSELLSDTFPAIEACADELGDDIAAALELRASHMGLGVYAVLRASGQAGKALPLLATVVQHGRKGADAALFEAAARDEDSAFELARLRHRVANNDLTARAALKRLAKSTTEKAIAAEALDIAHAPEPLTSAPSLWSFNGFGTNVFGSRDPDPRNGSEIKTLCITAVFVPIFPLRAYRVIDHGDSSYTFMSKNRLSGFARAYQKLFAAGVVALIAFLAINSYLSSPGRQASKALAAADAARDAGDVDAAVEGYERVIDRYWGDVDRAVIAGAATKAATLRLGQIERPLEPGRLNDGLGVIRAVAGYPMVAREAAVGPLAPALLGWSDDLAEAGAPEAAITLLDTALDKLNPGAEVRQRADALKLQLAAALAPRRPFDALQTLIDLGGGDKAGELIASMIDRPSLLREASALIERWLQGHPDDAVRSRLAEAIAKGNEPTRIAALEGDDARALDAALAKHPGDHELTAALAELDRAAGKPRDAIDRLGALGEAGWLIGPAQHTLAMAHVDAGELEAADEILGELLRYRLPAFRVASAAYRQAAESFRNQLVTRAESGQAPPDVTSAIRGSDQALAMERFEAWAAAEMSQDSRLAGLREEYQRHGIVVAASLGLGTIKLQRANQVGGEGRDKLLAEAEQTFLAISEDAAGLPSYQLGLGQVYHRLGKSDQGDNLFDSLISGGDPTMALQVSRAYRELGNNTRAQAVAEQVYNTAASPIREAAAAQLSFIVDELDDKQMWLERADAKNPDVRVSLDEVKARRASMAGDDKQAAELYRNVARHYEKNAGHSSAAANNAAIAYRGIYQATGDREALARARAGLESALRLEPTNALVVANLAEHAQFEGWLEVLAAEVPVDRMRLTFDDVGVISGQLESGSKLAARAAKNALLRRSAELTSQQTVLAPSGTAGWERAIAIARQRGDLPGLEAIARQLERVAIDTSGQAKAKAAWNAGERDDALREQLATEIARRTQQLAAARASRSVRAIAVARLLLGTSLAASGWHDQKVEPLVAALEHAEAARQGWPELGDTVTGVALRLAIVRVAKKSPAVEAMRAAGFRIYSPTMMLADKLIGDGSAIRSALAGDPAIAASARILASSDVEATLGSWVVGVLAGDRALAERGVERLAVRHDALATKLAVKLNPLSESAALGARLYAEPDLMKSKLP